MRMTTMTALALAGALGWPVVAGAAGDDEPIAYGQMVMAGRVDDPRITESSGIAASRLEAGTLWTHNDSGGDARLFQLEADGALRRAVDVDLPRPTDWEDICSFELDGQAWLLVGDIGDNGGRRRHVTLWLIAEPPAGATTATPARRIDVRFADGPRDCESLAFDPVTRQVILISKIDPRRDFEGFAGVYVLDLSEASTKKPVVVDRAATLQLKIPTAADVSPDGRRCMVTTYGDVYVYRRAEGQGWAEAFASEPQRVFMGPRGQCEAGGYDADGRAMVFTSEGVGRVLWKVSPAE